MYVLYLTLTTKNSNKH